jgi:hypothetical protein
MVDNVATFALGYATKFLSLDLVGRYVMAVRAVRLSDRSEQDRVRMLIELTTPAHVVFVARRRRHVIAMTRSMRRLKAMLDDLNKPS